MKPNQGIDPREYELETGITDGNRAIHSSEWMETDLHKSQPRLSLLRKRAALLKRSDYLGKSGNSATGERKCNLRETESEAILETEHFGAK